MAGRKSDKIGELTDTERFSCCAIYAVALNQLFPTECDRCVRNSEINTWCFLLIISLLRPFQSFLQRQPWEHHGVFQPNRASKLLSVRNSSFFLHFALDEEMAARCAAYKTLTAPSRPLPDCCDSSSRRFFEVAYEILPVVSHQFLFPMWLSRKIFCVLSSIL